MIIIRAYEPTDLDQLIRLYKTRAAYGGSYDETRDEAERLDATSQQGNLLVAEIDSQVVGSAMILDNPHSFWLLRFVIDPEIEPYDKIADSLMEEASCIAKQRGHQSVIVYSNPKDEALSRRYEKLGCRKGGKYQCFWKEIK